MLGLSESQIRSAVESQVNMVSIDSNVRWAITNAIVKAIKENNEKIDKQLRGAGVNI